MPKLVRLAAAASVAALMTGGVLVSPASAAPAHDYSCSNQGGAADHTVNCSGLITIADVLSDNKVNISVKDIDVLNDAQLATLETALTKVAGNDILLPSTIQLADLQLAVVNTYVNDFKIKLSPANVMVCIGRICL
ncbi:hypothetical protein [Streptomyces sp. L2]|uniref:hypothetical protein n=1 Tax=Streptomyces sp. L2 TaxID=2162665 RepID=UPI00101178E4|nr:hypothetical protein [Streptomyces sp. L2]